MLVGSGGGAEVLLQDHLEAMENKQKPKYVVVSEQSKEKH